MSVTKFLEIVFHGATAASISHVDVNDETLRTTNDIIEITNDTLKRIISEQKRRIIALHRSDQRLDFETMNPSS